MLKNLSEFPKRVKTETVILPAKIQKITLINYFITHPMIKLFRPKEEEEIKESQEIP